MELTHSHAAADTALSTRAEKRLLLLLLWYHTWDLSTLLVQKVTNTSVVVIAALPAEVQQWSCVGRQEHGHFSFPVLSYSRRARQCAQLTGATAITAAGKLIGCVQHRRLIQLQT